MLTHLLFQILDWLFSFMTLALLMRVLMQWARAPFRNPLGQFVIAVTDWAVIPARRMIPSIRGLDAASLALAWLAQLLFQGVVLAGSGAGATLIAPAGFVTLALLAVLGVLRVALYLLTGIVLISALMSWINPFAPLAPLFNLLTRPFLAPLQRFIPPIGGVDLSPMALLLILQVLLTLLAGLQSNLLPPRFGML